MQRRYSLAHLILAGVIVLVLTLLMVCVDAQARIAFMSDRDWNWEIYVMDNHGGNQRNLTNNPGDDRDPSWSPDGKRIAFSSDRNDRGGEPANLRDERRWGESAKPFPTMTLMTRNLHGLRTVNRLSLCWTGKST